MSLSDDLKRSGLAVFEVNALRDRIAELEAQLPPTNFVSITTNGTTRLIPADEPVFLIRGQDEVGGNAVRAWVELAAQAGASPDILSLAFHQAEKMDAWPKKKTPDRKVTP